MTHQLNTPPLDLVDFCWIDSIASEIERELLFRPSQTQILRLVSLIPNKFKEARMSKNGATKSRSASNQSNLVWLAIKFSEQDVSDFEEWDPDPSDLLAGILQMAEDGINISLRRNKTNGQQFDIFCIGDDSFPEVSGRGFSGFAPSPLDACKVAVFKYHFLLKRQFPASSGKDRPLFG